MALDDSPESRQVAQARCSADGASTPSGSEHYYFRHGFADVDEYWSFCLPPERAEEFLHEYAKLNRLPPGSNAQTFPHPILGATDCEAWVGRYWFRSFGELDRLYYRKYLFCGYSAKRHRIYLSNWND